MANVLKAFLISACEASGETPSVSYSDMSRR